MANNFADLTLQEAVLSLYYKDEDGLIIIANHVRHHT